MKQQLITLSKKLGFKSNIKLIHGNYKPVDGGEVSNLLYYLWLCELQKWLRENYEIHVEIKLTDDTLCFHYEYVLVTSNDRYYNDEDMIDWAKRHWSNKKYDTYEKALEEGLLESLKLI